MAGNKFSSDPFNVTFFPGSEMSTVHKITIVPDNLYESFESFYLEIMQIYAESSLRGQLRIGNTSTIRVTIIDNDGELATVGAWIACMHTQYPLLARACSPASSVQADQA